MPARAPAPLAAVLLALPALAALAGCGGVGVSTASTTPGDELTVYSSLPLEGPSAVASQQIVDGEKLALAQVGGRVGRFRIDYASLDDANPKTGEAAPGVTATYARVAAQDTSTIAYLGDLDSAASAVSLPLTNAAGILQVSPGSPYVGLTSSLDAGQDEPYRFYLTGQRTFGRLVPGDPVQAAAQVRLARELHLRRVYVLEDQDPFNLPLAELFAEDARRAGLEVAGEEQLDTEGTTEFAGVVQKVLESGARAVFFSGAPGPGAVALWQQTARGRLPPAPARHLRARRTGLRRTGRLRRGPHLPDHPAAAALALPRPGPRRPGRLPAALSPDAWALRAVRVRGDERGAARDPPRRAPRRRPRRVIHQFFAIRDRDSVLGRYSVLPNGDTTLSRYAVDRVEGGRLVFYRAFQLPPAG